MALPRGREVLQLLLEDRHGRAEKKKKVAGASEVCEYETIHTGENLLAYIQHNLGEMFEARMRVPEDQYCKTSENTQQRLVKLYLH